MEPLSVYIDTNILNDIAPVGIDWEQSDWGKSLKDLSDRGIIEVYASPGNCMEIALRSDLDHRNNMARALNTLIKGQRMLPPYEYFIVENLLGAIGENWPGTIDLNRLETLKLDSARNYIALLGQLAALRDYDCSYGFSGIIRPKIITQIIHSSIFADPKTEIENRLEVLRKKSFSKSDSFAQYDGESIADLQLKEMQLKGKKYPIDKTAIELLKKSKEELITGYSLEEVYFSLDQVFVYWEDLNNTIVDFPNIVSNWEKIHPLEKRDDKHKVKPLPPDLVIRFSSQKQIPQDTIFVLKAMADRFFGFLTISKTYYSTIINELEKALNEGEIPTGGLVLDCHHAIGSIYTNFFLTRDSRLLSTVKSWHKNISSKYKVYRDSAADLSEFNRKIATELNKSKK